MNITAIVITAIICATVCITIVGSLKVAAMASKNSDEKKGQ